MTKTETKTKSYERTIDEDLFKLWQMLRRNTDIKELCEITGKSNPVIYRALNFGFVRDLQVEKDITAFYENRAEEQRESARKISKNLTK